jgi:hypothetical protein
MANEESPERIGRTNWNDDNQGWDLQGMSRAMYEWLGSPVPGSKQLAGWEVSGTLNPDNPDPTKMQPPPSWRTPEVTMQSTCAWFAGAIQDYLIGNGLVPLVRATVNEDGQLLQLSGAKLSVATGRIDIDPALQQYAYYLIIDQEDAIYPLTDASSIVVTPISAEEAILSQVLPVTHRNPAIYHNVFTAIFEKYVGWFFQFKDAGNSSAYVHVHA